MMSLMLLFSADEGRCFETEPSHLPVGVCIDNLTKVNNNINDLFYTA